LLAIVVQCSYLFYFFWRIFCLPRYKARVSSQSVSVIICARNEAANLLFNLPVVLSQRYRNGTGKPMYEVIVVNDASTDDTEDVLNALKIKYPHLKIVNVSVDTYRTLPGKKFALSYGVATAANNWLLMTDADCTPASEHWLAGMVAPLIRGKTIALGYGAYRPAPGLLNAFVRWETAHTFLQYATYAMVGMPYMGVGRNLACTKDTLLKAQSSTIWASLPSGDDDFLVRIGGSKKNTGVVANPLAFTYTDAKNNFGEWMRQKQRHLSTGKFYKPWLIILLGFYACSHALMWLAAIMLLFTVYAKWTLLFVAVRCLLYWGVLAYTTRKMHERKLLTLLPLFDFGWMVYNFAFAPYVFWKNKRQWR
jgi:glycosyltransferase involved in cell wall biosynthesis